MFVRKWKESDERIFRELYPLVSNERLCQLFNCDMQRIYHKACMMNLKKEYRYWKGQPQKMNLRKTYPQTT